MRIAYFDCFSGAGGDMIVASLVHAGADASALQERLRSLDVGGFSLAIEPVTKQGFAATLFKVTLDDAAKQPHRHLKDVVALIGRCDLSDTAKDRSTRIFERLAEAEAKVHGTSVDAVHFHEVGAVDSILDIIGAVCALELLGIDQVICSPIPTGSGVVRCEHGVMPIPAPATAELLTGVPLAACDETGELTTPTAAAVLTTLSESFGPLPAMTIGLIGYGAGTREGQTRPNILRVLIGEAAEAGGASTVVMLETNVDDASPEIVGYCMERLMAAGALDVYAVPIHMKKWRTGVKLSVLCEHAQVSELEHILFAETTTFGVRRYDVLRSTMRRRVETVATPYGAIRVKVGERSGVVSVSPEFEDCREAAQRHGVALRTVMTAAQSAWSAS